MYTYRNVHAADNSPKKQVAAETWREESHDCTYMAVCVCVGGGLYECVCVCVCLLLSVHLPFFHSFLFFLPSSMYTHMQGYVHNTYIGQTLRTMPNNYMEQGMYTQTRLKRTQGTPSVHRCPIRTQNFLVHIYVHTIISTHEVFLYAHTYTWLVCVHNAYTSQWVCMCVRMCTCVCTLPAPRTDWRGGRVCVCVCMCVSLQVGVGCQVGFSLSLFLKLRKYEEKNITYKLTTKWEIDR